MRVASASFLLLSLVLAACKPQPGSTPVSGDTTGSAPAPRSEDKDELVIRGTLTSEGVECPAMRGDDGTLYTLASRDTHGFNVGDKVCVRGRRAEMSFCQQGITIAVTSIGPATDCP